MTVTLSDLAKRISSDEDNCFLLYGKEDYYIERAVNSIKKKYLTAGFESMDYIKLDFGGKSVDIEKVSENIELPAWSSLKRVVEVCNFDYEKLDADKTIKLINSVPDSTVVIFRTISIDKRKKKLFEAFDKNGIVSEIDYLDEEIFTEEDDEETARDLFGDPVDDDDPLYDQALEIVVQAGKASASYIQRRLKIGYNRAARLVEEMEERGIVGPANGSKPREIIHMP